MGGMLCSPGGGCRSLGFANHCSIIAPYLRHRLEQQLEKVTGFLTNNGRSQEART
jgi:hypothetical protein